MKVIKNTSATRLLTRFDNELKNILTKDLKAFAANNTFFMGNKQATTRSTLSVA
jgi:hypothetical protein